MQGYNCIIVYSPDGQRALFCKRLKDPYKGLFNLVGGKIEAGENGFAAAYRELAEETGITSQQITLKHMMDFTYYNQDCYVEIYAGRLTENVNLKTEYHPLHWLSIEENFFDMTKFAGEGNIGHMFQQVKDYGMGVQPAPAPDEASASQSTTNASQSSTNATPSPTNAPAQPPAKSQDPYTILCYGDSNTYGYNPCTGLRYPATIRWTDLLQKRLGNGYLVLNEGCNGRTAFATPEAEPWKFGGYGLESCLNGHKPINMIIMMLGSNDLKTKFKASASDIASGVKDLIAKSKDFLQVKQGFAPEVLLVSPAVLGDAFSGADGGSAFSEEFDKTSIEKSKEFAKAYKRVADETGSIFLDAAEMIQSSPVDSLHLSPDAHATLAEAFAKSILK